MKTPLEIIQELVKKYPNDMQLGSKVRAYIHWLKGLLKDKPEDV
tara:strand:- start:159 stop:290 length:132 start_codon:yes stop_codon:yes gene_type:complete